MLFSVIGWTIIHSLWQCLGLLAGLKLFLGLTDVRRSAIRYAAALGVLILAMGAMLGTFLWEWRGFWGGVGGGWGGGGVGLGGGGGGGFFVGGGAGCFCFFLGLRGVRPS